MAKLLDKDPFVYEQEKTGFLQTLHQFLASKGSPFSQSPALDAKELDLYLLYLKVTELGGFQKVTDEEQWDDLLRIFQLPGNCSHAANELRQIYVKYLELYEKVHFLGEDEDDKDRSGSRSFSTPVRSATSTQKGYQVPSTACRNLLPNVSEYDKLHFSLLSGLPNEVDFAINVCTLLSNEGRHVLHLARAPRLIDHLLAHAGVFFEGPGSLRALYEESWRANADRDFVQFWYDTVNDEEVQEIIGPEPFKPPDKRHFKDPQLFCQRKLGLLDVEGQRILQIAIILKNLSFEGANRSIMAAHRTLYRFLLLCIHNSCSMLRQVGTDTLSNLAPEFVLDSIAYRSTQLMFHTIYKGLEDDDRFIVLRSLEVVEKLLEVANNIEVLEQCLEHRVYHTVINLLHIHDIQILLGALELLLVMSGKGNRFCTFICKVDRSIDVLVCLVTLDAQSLGADAFVGIKIVDPNPEGQQHHQPAPHQVMAGGPRPGLHHAPTPPPTQQQQQVTPGAKSPARGGTSLSVPPGTSTPPATPMSTKDAEAERFACQWLNCHVESNKELSVARVELYAEYLAACKQAKGNVLSSTNFARCVRLSYPHVGMKKVTGATVQYHLAGIGRRKQPLPFTWKPQEAVTNVLSSNARTASTMMAHLASRHSPSPNAVAASPPPQRSMPYPPPPQGGTPHLQRGLPPPPPYSQGQQMAGSHQSYHHGSPQVMNVRTGYPPGQQCIPQMAGAPPRGGPLPPYQSPQHPHPSQQYRPPGGMAPSRLVFGHNLESNMSPAAGGNSVPGVQPQQMSHQPHSFPQRPLLPQAPTHVQQSIAQTGHPGIQMSTGGPQGPSHPGPQIAAGGLQVELSRPPPPIQQGTGFQGPHIQLGRPLPSQATNNTATHSGPTATIQQGQGHGVQNAPNGLVVFQGTNGNIVLQRAPEVPMQVQEMNNTSETPAGGPTLPNASDPAPPSVSDPAPPSVSDTAPPSVSHPPAQPPQENSITSTATPSTAPQESSSAVGVAPVDSPLDPPQPPIPPPSNPMVDALSPTGRSTPCPSEVSVRSQTDSELASNATDGDGTSEQRPPPATGPATGPSGELLDGEVRIQKVPNACADGEKETEQQPSASDVLNTVPESALPQSASVSSETPSQNPTLSDKGTPSNKAPSANASFTSSARPPYTPSTNVPILPKTSLPAPAPKPEPQMTASGNKITVTVPTHPVKTMANQPAKSITLVHTNTPLGTSTIVSPVVHQVVPASGPPGQIRNVLVPSQGIVLNVQPVVQGQMQIATPGGISLQPRPATPRQQPVNIQPKPIQPKPTSSNQSTAQTTVSTSQAKAISIQPSTTTLIHPGQPMMALQRHPGAPGGTQIVLGQSFVVQPQNQGQSSMAQPQFVANIQPRMPFQQGQAMVVTSSAPQPNPSGSGATPPMVSFGCTTQVNSQSTDAPLIKRLLQQNTPLTPNRQQIPVQQSQPQQMQLVQSSQGQLVAVNTTTWPPAYQQRQQGLVNIAPRPPVTQTQQSQTQPPQTQPHLAQLQYQQNPQPDLSQHPQDQMNQQQYQQNQPQPQLSLSVPKQQLINLPMCGPMQYPIGGFPPPSIDQISLPGDLSSPTSSTSSGSKSKKKKSKHKKSKKSKKQHSSSKQRAQSPASIISETVSEANPSENSQDSMDHPIMVPPTPDINNPLRTGFSNALPPNNNNSAPTCNGDAPSPAVTPKKPPAKKSKPRSPKPAVMTPPVTPNKIVNGVGEEVMTPVEALIERIENPHYVDPQARRTNPTGQSNRGDNGMTCPVDRNEASGNQGDQKNPSAVMDHSQCKKDPTVLSQGMIERGSGEGKMIVSGNFEINEKNLNNSNDMESVVNHFRINGDMTDDFLKNQLTAALENKLKKEIVKEIRKSIEKDQKTMVGGVQGEEILQQNNKEKQLSNCDSFVNNIFSKDQKMLGGGTNGPIRRMENGDITANGETPYTPNEGYPNNVRKGVTANGHPEGYPYLLSPNTSVSSSPIGSPPLPPMDHNRLAGPIVTSQQAGAFHHHQQRGLHQQQDQRGTKRSAEEMARCDTPSSVGSGPISPSGLSQPSEAPKKSGSSKKRRSSSTSSSGRRERKSSGKGKNQAHRAPPQQQPAPMSAFFICEWNRCHKNLSSAKSLHAHTYKEHVMSDNYKGVCEWEGCDNIKRQRWSTVTHIQEKHCSEQALLMAAERRTQQSLEDRAKEPAPAVNPVVYNAHTAYHAIRRSLQPPSLGDLLGEKEGPVTRSIRITASLILKNIARYSEEGRSLILRYEDRLSHVALSKAESSTTISKCLWLARQDDDR